VRGFEDANWFVIVPQRYFDGRTDGLRSPDNAEELLVAIS
jgi:hypothetical protein